MSRRARLLLGVLAGVAVAALGLVIVIGALQRRLIYFPTQAEESDLIVTATASGLEPWRDRTGALIGWRSRDPRADARRLVVFHGNAGHALDRVYLREGFRRLAGGEPWDVLLFEYPGYGCRPGRPGDEAIMASARAAIEELRGTDAGPVFLAGESIGSGVACHIAGAMPDAVAGLFLITPFTSLADVAAMHYPFLPVRLLLREHYDNVEALKGVRCRLAVLLAGRDEVIPTRIGQRLFDSYGGPKRLWVQAHATHNMLDYDPDASWWVEVAQFLGEPPGTRPNDLTHHSSR